MIKILENKKVMACVMGVSMLGGSLFASGEAHAIYDPSKENQSDGMDIRIMSTSVSNGEEGETLGVIQPYPGDAVVESPEGEVSNEELMRTTTVSPGPEVMAIDAEGEMVSDDVTIAQESAISESVTTDTEKGVPVYYLMVGGLFLVFLGMFMGRRASKK